VTSGPTDPVTARRARIARGVSLAKRVGYLLLGAAVVLFALALVTDFPGALVTATIVTLVGACVVLPVPIVMGYGLRAAEREDREQGFR
jgi:NADH:ubiquinone oxidoreductase subunit 6 (subunit J)